MGPTTFSGTLPFPALYVYATSGIGGLYTGFHTAILSIEASGQAPIRKVIQIALDKDAPYLTANPSDVTMVAYPGMTPERTITAAQGTDPTSAPLTISGIGTLNGGSWLQARLDAGSSPCSTANPPYPCSLAVTTEAPSASGEYYGVVSIRDPKRNKVAYIRVKLLVVVPVDDGSGGEGAFRVEPTVLNLGCEAGGKTEPFDIRILGSPVDFSYEIAGAPSWLTSEIDQIRTPATMRVRANCAGLAGRYQVSISFLQAGFSAGPSLTIFLTVSSSRDPITWLSPLYLTGTDLRNRITLLNAGAETGTFQLRLRDGSVTGLVEEGALPPGTIKVLEPAAKSNLRSWSSLTTGPDLSALHLMRSRNSTLDQWRETYLPTPASPASRLWIPYDDSVGAAITQISLANPGATTAQCTRTIWASGRNTVQAQVTVPTGASVLFPADAGTGRKTGVVALDCGKSAITGVALRQNEIGNWSVYESLPGVADIAERSVVIPFVPDGVYHNSVVLLVNTSDKEQAYSLKFYKNRAKGALDVVADPIGKLAPGAMVALATQGKSELPAFLSQLSTPPMWAELTASRAVQGVVYTGHESNGPNPSESAYAFGQPPRKQFRLVFDNTGGMQSSVVLVNSGDKKLGIAVKIWGETGENLTTETVEVEAGAALHYQVKTPGTRGFVGLDAEGVFSVLGVRAGGRPFTVFVPPSR